MVGAWVYGGQLALEIPPAAVAVGYVAPEHRGFEDEPLAIVARFAPAWTTFLEGFAPLRAAARGYLRFADGRLEPDLHEVLRFCIRYNVFGIVRVHDHLLVRMQETFCHAYLPTTWADRWVEEAPVEGDAPDIGGRIFLDVPPAPLTPLVLFALLGPLSALLGPLSAMLGPLFARSVRERFRNRISDGSGSSGMT